VSQPPRLPGTIFAYDPARPGRRRPVRAVEGMLTTREATALTGINGLTLRLWVDAFRVGCRFVPRGPVFVYPHLVLTLAQLRDARGALPRHACEPDHPRHHLINAAIYESIKARAVPPDAVIARIRHQLGLPARTRPRLVSDVRTDRETASVTAT
jgi:hypothetical protein